MQKNRFVLIILIAFLTGVLLMAAIGLLMMGGRTDNNSPTVQESEDGAVVLDTSEDRSDGSNDTSGSVSGQVGDRSTDQTDPAEPDNTDPIDLDEAEDSTTGSTGGGTSPVDQNEQEPEPNPEEEVDNGTTRDSRSGGGGGGSSTPQDTQSNDTEDGEPEVCEGFFRNIVEFFTGNCPEEREREAGRRPWWRFWERNREEEETADIDLTDCNLYTLHDCPVEESLYWDDACSYLVLPDTRECIDWEGPYRDALCDPRVDDECDVTHHPYYDAGCVDILNVFTGECIDRDLEENECTPQDFVNGGEPNCECPEGEILGLDGWCMEIPDEWLDDEDEDSEEIDAEDERNNDRGEDDEREDDDLSATDMCPEGEIMGMDGNCMVIPDDWEDDYDDEEDDYVPPQNWSTGAGGLVGFDLPSNQGSYTSSGSSITMKDNAGYVAMQVTVHSGVTAETLMAEDAANSMFSTACAGRFIGGRPATCQTNISATGSVVLTYYVDVFGRGWRIKLYATGGSLEQETVLNSFIFY